MGYKFRDEHPPRQRLTLELVVILATFLVVIGVWTRTVVLGDPTPSAIAPAPRLSTTTADHSHHQFHARTGHQAPDRTTVALGPK